MPPNDRTAGALGRDGRTETRREAVRCAVEPSLAAKSRHPSVSIKRIRVKVLTITRWRSMPSRSSRQHDGSLPYMRSRKSPARSPLRQASTSPARRSAWSASQCGGTPACVISVSPRRTSKGRLCSQSSSASRSGASRMAARVSLRLRPAPPRATASRCRSWLPSTTSAHSPSAMTSRRQSSEAGPRLTRSPASQSRSRRGSNDKRSSRATNSAWQPCRSPMA